MTAPRRGRAGCPRARRASVYRRRVGVRKLCFGLYLPSRCHPRLRSLAGLRHRRPLILRLCGLCVFPLLGRGACRLCRVLAQAAQQVIHQPELLCQRLDALLAQRAVLGGARGTCLRGAGARAIGGGSAGERSLEAAGGRRHDAQVDAARARAGRQSRSLARLRLTGASRGQPLRWAAHARPPQGPWTTRAPAAHTPRPPARARAGECSAAEQPSRVSHFKGQKGAIRAKRSGER